MPSSLDLLEKLVLRVGEFYITDKGMKKAQDRISALLQNGAVDASETVAYLHAVRRYFSGFEREAREHLRVVDKRLEQANQVVFNLTAERAVAVRRIDGTQGVLHELTALESPGVHA
ncbi:MAG: hypothetical protein M3N19_10750 [Candidatus Eremiobacteraeota bacterium]|nr:hypothetical protein [Candidatus Eremiobacteraeota bacterium]